MLVDGNILLLCSLGMIKWFVANKLPIFHQVMCHLPSLSAVVTVSFGQPSYTVLESETIAITLSLDHGIDRPFYVGIRAGEIQYSKNSSSFESGLDVTYNTQNNYDINKSTVNHISRNSVCILGPTFAISSKVKLAKVCCVCVTVCVYGNNE